MATRTPYASTALEVLTSANFEKMPKGWIGYVTVTSGQSAITSEADLTDLTITFTAQADRIYRVQPRVRFNVDNTGTANIVGLIYVDGTSIGSFMRSRGIQNDEEIGAAPGLIIDPAAGSHTVKLTAERTGGTGVFTTAASATNFNWLLIEDIGPAA